MIINIQSQGRVQDFQIEGAQEIMSTQRTSQARSVKSLSAGVKGPLEGLGSSRVLDALSCYLSLILTHSDIKLGFKNVVSHNLEVARACCAPSVSATESTVYLVANCNSFGIYME